MQARDQLRRSVEFSTFLSAAQDFQTHNGEIRHYGVADRGGFTDEHGNSKGAPWRLMGYKSWLGWQMVCPNTKWENGPRCARAFTKAPAGSRLLRNWVVLDLDESKNGHHRSQHQIINSLPPNMFDLVPTRSAGHYQAWYLLDSPIDDATHVALKPHLVLWGDDSLFKSNTLAWGPIYRSLNPNAAGERTWWHPAVLEGECPTVSVQDLLHPNYEQDFVVRKSWGQRCDLSDLVAQMSTMTEGRSSIHYRYVLKRVPQIRTSERDYQAIADAAWEGNEFFAEERDDAKVINLAQHMWQDNPWKHQSNRAKMRDQSSQAELRYEDYQQKLLALNNSTSLSLGRCTPFSGDELRRARDYQGRPGTQAHLAYALDMKLNNLKQVFKRGKQRTGETT